MSNSDTENRFNLVALAKYSPFSVISYSKGLRKSKEGKDYEVYIVKLQTPCLLEPVETEMFSSQWDTIRLLKLAGGSGWFNITVNEKGRALISGAIITKEVADSFK